MFQAIVITLREGVEAALVLAIALTLLRRSNRSHLAGALFAGAGAALLVSIGVAALVTRITFNEELMEGVVMLVGAVLVFSLVYWMWRAAPRMREEVESGMERATAAGAGAGVFLFAFGMLFREGVETAIFLSAARFNSEGVNMWLGAAIGLALAAAFGVLFVRGTLRVPLKPFFTITTAVLVLLGLQLIVGGLHELSEAEVIPASKTEMAIIGPIVKNELLFFTLTIALVAGWLLFARAQPSPSPATGAAAGRLERSSRMREGGRRRWTGAVGLVVVALLTTAFIQGSRIPGRAPATPLDAFDGEVAFDAAALDDGGMHFYEVVLDGVPVRFFAIRVGDDVHTCFDGCQICGDVGYFQDGALLICRNCTSPIAPATLGRSGGCNPIPLESRVEAGRVIVRATDITAGTPLLEGR